MIETLGASTQRFTPEFKEEAVKQVIDRGYGAPEVAGRLGVSAHSLYKWVEAVSAGKSVQQSKELLEAKGDILRLRSRARRVEEERDLLKKAARYFAKGPRVKYRFMIGHRRDYAITLMCGVLRVSRARSRRRARSSALRRPFGALPDRLAIGGNEGAGRRSLIRGTLRR